MVAPQQLWIGYTLIVLAGVIFVWGLKLHGEHWWKRLWNRHSVKVQSANDLTGWVPLHMALRYIALRSVWGFDAKRAPWKAMDESLEREVSERLARGELAARGREVLSTAPYRLTATSVAIPDDFWPTAFFQAFGEIVLSDDHRGATSRDGKYLHVPEKAYREVVVDMAEVRKIWPEASQPVRKSGKSQYHFALLEYWKGEIMQDYGFAADVEMWARK